MIIDAHCHANGVDKDGTKLTIDELKKSMKTYGIDKSILFPFDVEEDLLEASINIAKISDEDILPFLRFDPKLISATKIEEVLKTYRFYGVKLHPRSQSFDPLDKKFYQIYEVIESMSLPIIFHTRKENIVNSDPDRIAGLAEDFPGMNIILGHFANMSPEAISRVERYRNLYLETSVMSSNYTIKVIAGRVGSDKLIFGSDIPYSDQEIELLKIKKSGLADRDKEKILCSNIMKLIHLE
ncbi:MAG: amidohydrolase family protein [Candidatus Marsarchaeota archaeon]|nr:amidohydrolase family protein [Candidatus Marsarchaeota archaeon]